MSIRPDERNETDSSGRTILSRFERELNRVLSVAEDVVYGLAALLLAGASVYVLASAALLLVKTVFGGADAVESVLGVLDQILVGLIFVELFYTVRLSIRQHQLAVEPFVAVALIAVVRRILVVTAEEHRLVETEPSAMSQFVLELGLLAGLVLVLAIAMRLLHKMPLVDPISGWEGGAHGRQPKAAHGLPSSAPVPTDEADVPERTPRA
jgi:uncharacterized membrane protein (DUF373 family)